MRLESSTQDSGRYVRNDITADEDRKLQQQTTFPCMCVYPYQYPGWHQVSRLGWGFINLDRSLTYVRTKTNPYRSSYNRWMSTH